MLGHVVLCKDHLTGAFPCRESFRYRSYGKKNMKRYRGSEAGGQSHETDLGLCDHVCAQCA